MLFVDLELKEGFAAVREKVELAIKAAHSSQIREILDIHVVIVTDTWHSLDLILCRPAVVAQFTK